MVQLLQQHLARVQLRQKQQADKNRTERSFLVGDMVFLKIQPYVQSSLQKRANHKLTFKYFGPYKIVQKIGAVAYRLQLPAYSSVHPVFHVSLLKRAVGANYQVSSQLPDFNDDVQVPVKVLDRRVYDKDDVSRHQILVQWSAWPPSLATWEFEDDMKHRFPDAPDWGQAVSKGRRDVTGPSASAQSTTASPSSPAQTPRRRQPNPKYSGPNWVRA